MKKTTKMGRILSVAALLLVMAMLFTSCAVNFAKANMADYVSIADSGYNGLKVTVDKNVYTDEVVRQKVLDSLRTVKEGFKDKEAGNVERYDEVFFYTWAVDANGNVALSSLARDEQGNISPEKIRIGYGTNTGLLLDIEKLFYDATDPANPVTKDIKNHLLVYETAKTALIPTGAFYFLTFTSMNENKVSTVNQSSEYLLNTSVYDEVVNGEKAQSTNDYFEAIALALAKVNATADGSENHKGSKIGGLKTIRIFPTATPDSEITGAEDDSTVNIKYDIDFATVGGTNYTKGTISLTTKAAAYLSQGDAGTASEGFKATPLSMSYTFPEDYTGQYTVDGTKTDLKGVTVTAYIYPVSKTSYEMPEYNPTTDEEKTALIDAIKAKFTSDLTDVEELKKAYEAHMRVELEKEYVAAAEASARQAIWNAVVGNATVLNYPKANIKAYMREAKNNLKYYYSSYPNIYSVNGSYQYTTAKMSGLYKNYKEFAVEMYKTDEAYKAYSVKDFGDVEAILYNEGTMAVKEMMFTYYIADKLDLSVTDEEYETKVNAAAKTWIAEQEKSYLDAYGMCPTFTVEDYVASYGGEDNIRGAYLIEKVKDKLYELNKSGVTYNEIDVNAIAEEEATEEKKDEDKKS